MSIKEATGGQMQTYILYYIDCLRQDCSQSNVLTIELLQSCTNPLTLAILAIGYIHMYKKLKKLKACSYDMSFYNSRCFGETFIAITHLYLAPQLLQGSNSQANISHIYTYIIFPEPHVTNQHFNIQNLKYNFSDGCFYANARTNLAMILLTF